MTSLTMTNGGDISHGDSAVELIEKRAVIPVVVIGVDRSKKAGADESENTNVTKEDTTDESSYIKELENYKAEGFVNVIIAGNEQDIPLEIRNKLEEEGFNTERMAQGADESYGDWITKMIGLKNAPTLQFDPKGNCQYSAVISGGANSLEDANYEIKRVRALLSSGNLPAKTKMASESLVDPRHGAVFLNYCLYTGLFAILIVSLVILVRYKKMFIVIPVMVTCISEVILILGLASAVSWELDLLAVAGIIAAVGTGVDNQIVITDEILKRRKGEKAEVMSFTEQIGRAFFIIFTSAATIIAAMIPLFAIGAGMLKGFAFTTIMGVLFGVLITRPAFAAAIEFFLKR